MVARISYALLLTTTILSAATVVKKKPTYYLDFERPNVTYFNPKFFAAVTGTAQRKSRRDPIHYFNWMFETKIPFDNSVKIDVYVYEFLSNEYRRSFVELHFKVCDFFFKDKIFGAIYKQQLHVKTCPLPANTYHFKDLAFPNFPLLATFPFQKGRVYLNITNDFGEEVLYGHADAAIKTRYV